MKDLWNGNKFYPILFLYFLGLYPFETCAVRLSISNHLFSFDHADFEMFIHIQEGYTNWQCVNHPKLECHWLGEDEN